MGYLQTTTGVSGVGVGTTVTFSTPICAQLSLQVFGSPSFQINLETSLDGVTFSGPSVGGASAGTMFKSSSGQSFTPIMAMRYNVTSITAGTVSISIAAAPSGAE